MMYVYGRKYALDKVPVPCGFRELQPARGSQYKKLLMYRRPLTETEQRDCCLEFVAKMGRD